MLYVGYSECKYLLPIYLAYSRDCPFAHVQWLPLNWEATDAIFWNSCYVYVSSCALNIFKTIEGAADCKIRLVIHFLNAGNELQSEIHHQICQVYGSDVQWRTRERARWGAKWASICGEWWFGALVQRKSAWRQTFHIFWSVSALFSDFKDSTLRHCQ